MSCHTTSWLGFEHFFIHLPYHNIKDHTLSHTTSLFSSLFMCQTLSRAVSCLHPSKFLLVIDWDVIWTWLCCQVLCSPREVPHNRTPWKYRCQTFSLRVDWLFCQSCLFVCMVFPLHTCDSGSPESWVTWRLLCITGGTSAWHCQHEIIPFS